MNTSKTLQKAPPALPGPSAEEAEAIAAARVRNGRRGPRLKLQTNLKPDGRNTVDLKPPHSDGAGWDEQLRDAFGTSSGDFATNELAFLVGAAGAAREEGAHPKVANAMLAAVQGVKPENEVEAMLAVQMVSAHDLAMNLLVKAKASNDPEVTATHAGIAVKLMRTFAAQTEALAKLRRGGEQKVTVEHVHVYPGGQAVVGHVSVPGRGQNENGTQPYAPLDPRALVFAPSGPVLREDAGRVRMPGASCEGQDAVPDARRGKGQRRSQG
jgi:hypothetical protein